MEGSEVDPQQQQQQQQQRSKKQVKKRGRGVDTQNEYVPITEGLSEHVRRIRVDPKKDAAGEDKHLVLLSKVGKAPQLQLSEDRLSVTGYKGFRSIRGNHGVHSGTWYCEARITHAGPTGTAVPAHASCASTHAPARACLHVQVGLFLHMPEGGHPIEVQSQDVVRFKGSLYYVNEPEPTPKTLMGSTVAFSLNGQSQGAAYKDIPEGTYYPAASLYTLPEQTEGVTVAFNFGPNFAYAPPQIDGCPAARAWCELAAPQEQPPASAAPS
ncbi:hypothetical protein DUNSADRAFT_16565 [Dunaliella salina]|uniref:Set1/Ash2 histone methyltransferase complex subunit ASH2 n=1 Tax=Dunaliella salina TaxID=3046 RepID=A0ABQ7H0U1_DUNSA|nr:hypothetical protein DUNSADRAFT_16565 [Dunaliella salina]|eukprot:KAF5840474.1 hypothetical protein DUNSADRAFT_16565 [Dunaliella salina]